MEGFFALKDSIFVVEWFKPLSFSDIAILILSAIQGVTEFLPVSSVAHLELIAIYYEFTNQDTLIYICLKNISLSI